MTGRPTRLLMEWLKKGGLDQFQKGYEIKDSDFERFYQEAGVLHPDFGEEQRIAWATYCCLTHPEASAKKLSWLKRARLWLNF